MRLGGSSNAEPAFRARLRMEWTVSRSGANGTRGRKVGESETFDLFGEVVNAEEYKQAVSNLSEFFRLLREWKDKQAHEQETVSEAD